MDIPSIVQETTSQELEDLYKTIKADEENNGGNHIITKKQIAIHPSAPEHVLSDIHKSCTQPQIKLALLNNPNLPKSIVLSLCSDKHPEIKKLAGLRLKGKWIPGHDLNLSTNSTANLHNASGGSTIRKSDSGHKQQLFRRKGA